MKEKISKEEYLERQRRRQRGFNAPSAPTEPKTIKAQRHRIAERIERFFHVDPHADGWKAGSYRGTSSKQREEARKALFEKATKKGQTEAVPQDVRDAFAKAQAEHEQRNESVSIDGGGTAGDQPRVVETPSTSGGTEGA